MTDRETETRGAPMSRSSLHKDLLPQVKAAFAQYQPADKAAIEKDLAKSIEQALGADPETLPKVKKLRAPVGVNLRPRPLAIPIIQSIQHPGLELLAAKRTQNPNLATVLPTAFAI